MATLVLSDGTTFTGQPFGAAIDTDGEVVFTTGMTGYPESMTDPSFKGQIMVTTYPLIGNYGVPSEELNEWGFSKNLESEKIQINGLIVSQVSEAYSHQAAVSSLQRWMEHHNIPGITGIDTRALTKKLREKGVMLGRIVQNDSEITSHESRVTSIEDPNIRNLVAEVSIDKPVTYEPLETRDSKLVVIAYDCGMKRNIIRSFLKRGVTVVRVPWDYDLASHSGHFDGVFISNGPGDPKKCDRTIEQIRLALKKDIPTFGICLGNQLLALAIGGDTYKLPYGHRGMNQPCVEVICSDGSVCEPGKQRCLITSQNHGFAVKDELPKDWDVWFRNGNDGTVEGIRHASGKFFSVQFHPEATPGPEDANYLFDEFLAVMKAKS
jgi:carbamoyl-phosphate synthase small subunit